MRGLCDLYLYENVGGWIECSGCRFDDPWIVQLHTLNDALDHVTKHREAGHNVPPRLEADIIEMNPWNGT